MAQVEAAAATVAAVAAAGPAQAQAQSPPAHAASASSTSLSQQQQQPPRSPSAAAAAAAAAQLAYSSQSPAASQPAPKVSDQQLRQALFQQQQLYKGFSYPTNGTVGSAQSGAWAARSPLGLQQLSQNTNGPLCCSSCGTAETPLWRRESTGKVVCNACGLASVRKQAPGASNGPSGLAHAGQQVARPTNSAGDRSAPQTHMQSARTTPTNGSIVTAQAAPNARPMHSGSVLSTQAAPIEAKDVAQTPPSVTESAQKPSEPPVGSCPGDGHCNGQGGQDCCRGCPAFNNRYRRDLAKHASRLVDPSQIGVNKPEKAAPTVITQMQKLHASDIRSGMQVKPQQPVSAPSAAQRQPDVVATTPLPTEAVTANMSMSARSDIGAMACENCGTRTTPLWRRDGEGRVACNACGLYYKLHGGHRPVNLNKPTIKRRKRAPASGPGTGDDETQTSGIANGKLGSADQSASGAPSARKKVRRSKENRDTEMSGTSSARSQSRTASPPSTSQPSLARPGQSSSGVSDLTYDELAAVTALAMHANHEKSLKHSANMDTEMLETHEHPLHSAASHAAGAASLDSLRDRSEPKAGGPPAQPRSEHEQLLAFKADLAKECSEAKSTITRLEAFLAKSERILSGIEIRLKSASPSVMNGHASPAASMPVDASTAKTKLDDLLASCQPTMAMPSMLLKRRREIRNEPAHPTARAEHSKILWEICPSTTQSLKVVAT